MNVQDHLKTEGEGFLKKKNNSSYFTEFLLQKYMEEFEIYRAVKSDK